MENLTPQQLKELTGIEPDSTFKQAQSWWLGTEKSLEGIKEKVEAYNKEHSQIIREMCELVDADRHDILYLAYSSDNSLGLISGLKPNDPDNVHRALKLATEGVAAELGYYVPNRRTKIGKELVRFFEADRDDTKYFSARPAYFLEGISKHYFIPGYFIQTQIFMREDEKTGELLRPIAVLTKDPDDKEHFRVDPELWEKRKLSELMAWIEEYEK